MKIDLIYPKIPENSDKFHGKCIAFEKYDGTNLHWEWSLQDGWFLFGTRRTQFIFNRYGIEEFTKIHPELSNAPHIFNDQFRDRLTALFCQNTTYRNSEMTVFTEFLGPNSFAGGHSEEDILNDDQDLVMIDVAIYGKIISPEKFREDFLDFPIARVVYTGKYSGQFAQDVHNGKFNVNEGVVVKGIVNGEVFMTKIKTKDYLKRLQER